jgi:uncharacterized protein
MLKYKLSKDTFKIVVLLYFFSNAFLLITYSNHDQKVSAQKDLSNTTSNFVKIKDRIIPVDLAITPDQQAMGLSFRNSLNASQGMLFLFHTPGDYSFWMKDMKFPLDILWINSDNNIVHIEKNLQPCVFILLCPSYSPHSISKYVLEVNSNYTIKNNITVGDRVSFNIANSTKP